MKLVFIILACAVVGVGVYGYFSAVSSGSKGGAPDIEITPVFYDFGTVNRGDILEKSFEVKNVGSGPLEIKRVATSCSCTKGEVGKHTLEPGESTELAVTYDTGAMSGPHGRGEQERIVYVQTNDASNPQVEVKIKGYVR